MAQINIRDQLLAFDSHFRPQATSHKPKETSHKLQAASQKKQATSLTNKNKGLYRNKQKGII